MKRFIQYIFPVFIGIFLFPACTGNFDVMNTDPNSATTIDPSLLFPDMEREAINGGYDDYQGADQRANRYVQWLATTATYISSDRYDYGGDSFWDPYYQYVLKDLLDIKRMTDSHPEYQKMYNIARIMTAICTARTTDVFGDIPYSEASRSVEQPKYDTQKTIYYDIFKELKEATDNLTKGFSSEQKEYGSQDIIYGGDASMWIKLGNSLRLRYALRLSFIDPEKAKAEGEAALTSTLMSSISDNAGMKNDISDWAGVGHPLYTMCYWNEFRMSYTFEKAYKELSSVVDPRMECYFGVTESTHGTANPQFKGLRNGLPADQMTLDGNKPADNSNIWGLLWAPEWNSGTGTPSGFRAFPYYTMCYSEVCFLKAEAAIRGWANAGNAQVDYENGIRASFDEARLGVSTSLYSKTNDEVYIQGGKVQWGESAGFETKLEKIATQKWIALFPNGTEAWAEVRRTGYPKLIPIIKSDAVEIDPSKGEFIKKLRYTDTERTENAKNALDQNLNGGKGDGENVRVWWDTNRYK